MDVQGLLNASVGRDEAVDDWRFGSVVHGWDYVVWNSWYGFGIMYFLRIPSLVGQLFVWETATSLINEL